MPPGVRLVRWEPKSGPVILTHYAVVTDVSRFISMTLLELRADLLGSDVSRAGTIERVREFGSMARASASLCKSS